MPRFPITLPRDTTTEEDGSFDSHFTESARSLLASFDAYMASQELADGTAKTPSPGKLAAKGLPEMELD